MFTKALPDMFCSPTLIHCIIIKPVFKCLTNGNRLQGGFPFNFYLNPWISALRKPGSTLIAHLSR
ncbi:Uncharacterised protein [Escherichia coli]|nr:Uncharacterised protein [Escherichia coli]SQZ15426.1 Uncharacterised protein [Escherichia coli]